MFAQVLFNCAVLTYWKVSKCDPSSIYGYHSTKRAVSLKPVVCDTHDIPVTMYKHLYFKVIYFFTKAFYTTHSDGHIVCFVSEYDTLAVVQS